MRLAGSLLLVICARCACACAYTAANHGTNSSTFPAWALAARIVFAISPNSASCERVFALLKNLFGEQQMSALADYVQAALMLNYNGRCVG